MSKTTDRIDELGNTLDTINAVVERALALRKNASTERTKLLAQEHKRKARKRK